MVITMAQTGRLAVQNLRDASKNFSQLGHSRGADAGARPLFQTVFDEMFKLPHIELEMQALVERDAGLVAFFAAADLQDQELIDGFPIPLDDGIITESLHPVP